jgi:hypothetical protein
MLDEAFSYEVPMDDDGTATVDTNDYCSDGYNNLNCAHCGNDFDEDTYRFCDGCASVMFEGFVYDGGTYCGFKCLPITEAEWNEQYTDDSDNYWTEWTPLKEVK